MGKAIILKPLEPVAITASSAATGHSAGFVANDFMGVVWRSQASGATQSLVLDMGSDVVVDTALLLACTGADADWTLKVEAATDALGSTFPGGSWIGAVLPFLAGDVMPKSGRGRALWMAPADAPPPSRYWRFTIGGLAGTAATVGRLALGERISLNRNFQFGASFGVRDMSLVEISRRGVLLRQRGAKLRAVGVTFGSVHRDEVDAHVQSLLEYAGTSESIALITDPDPDVQRQNRIWFGPMVGDIGTIWVAPDRFEWKCNVVDLYDGPFVAGSSIPAFALYDDLLSGYPSDDLLGGSYILGG